MKRIKWSFLAVALLAVASAFTTVKPRNFAQQEHQFLNANNGRVYLGEDVTNQTEGEDYECDPSSERCTVTVNSEDIKTDPLTGQQYVDEEDIIDESTGTFDSDPEGN